MSKKFKNLMEPGYIGPVKTRNRILKTGAHAGFHKYIDGFFPQGAIDYYESIARGGAGIVTIGAADINPPSVWYQMRATVWMKINIFQVSLKWLKLFISTTARHSYRCSKWAPCTPVP